MAILLILICLLGLVLCSFKPNEVRASILNAVLIFSLLVVGITEILSAFQSLNYHSLVVSWSVIDVVLIYLILKRKSIKSFSSFFDKAKASLKHLNALEKFLIGFSVFILLGIFVQGLIYPTNNWDSMAYHMARIIHWIQNESLMPFRTPVYPQINSPPFAEEVILNINLLIGNDYFSNAIQLFYLLGTIVAISLVAKQLGLNHFGQILSAFILVTIPEVILLGSSTHNEITVSFFLMASIYFFLKISKQPTLFSFLLLGCSLGLAVATKSTAYIYILPFLLIWAGHQCYQIVYKKVKLKWVYYLIMMLSFTAINFGQYARNYQLTSNILGLNSAVKNIYVNEEHSFGTLASNASRYLSNQFGVPKIAPIAEKLTIDFHKLINEDLNNSKTTYSTYSIDPLATHENNGANFFHTVFMLLSCIWFLVYFKKQDKRINLYWLAIVFSFLLFCFYLKWQPWVKLHTPFFVFYSIVLAHFLTKTIKSKMLFSVVLSGFTISASLILLFNYSRPYITFTPYTSEIKITDNRYKKYFSRFLYCYHDYKVVSEKINTENLENIGLMFGEYNMEYQLFLGSYRNNVKPIHLNAFELCEKIPVSDKLDCIVSIENQNVIDYEGEKFYNVTKDNDGYLFLFLKK